MKSNLEIYVKKLNIHTLDSETLPLGESVVRNRVAAGKDMQEGVYWSLVCGDKSQATAGAKQCTARK